jgi:hypothetical protein
MKICIRSGKEHMCLVQIVSQKLLKIDAQALVSFKKYMPPSSFLLQGKHLPLIMMALLHMAGLEKSECI